MRERECTSGDRRNFVKGADSLPQTEPKHGEVRVRVLAAGVSLPDIMMREGIHPETPRLPFTPEWDLVGVVDQLGEGTAGIEPGQRVAALPITGGHTEAQELLGKGGVAGEIVLVTRMN